MTDKSVPHFFLPVSTKSESIQKDKMKRGLSQQDAEKEKENIIQMPREETDVMERRTTKFHKANKSL